MTDLEEIIILANQLHKALVDLQNSGQFDKFSCSGLTMLADNLLEEIFILKDSKERHE